MAPIPVSQRLPPRGYDEPESLSQAFSPICLMVADGGQLIGVNDGEPIRFDGNVYFKQSPKKKVSI